MAQQERHAELRRELAAPSASGDDHLVGSEIAGTGLHGGKALPRTLKADDFDSFIDASTSQRSGPCERFHETRAEHLVFEGEKERTTKQGETAGSSWRSSW